MIWIHSITYALIQSHYSGKNIDKGRNLGIWGIGGNYCLPSKNMVIKRTIYIYTAYQSLHKNP